MKRASSPESREPDRKLLARRVLLIGVTMLTCGLLDAGEPTATAPIAATAEFPSELVDFVPDKHNPVFTAEGPGHWDVKIRERGWILHEGDQYRLWFTGYDGTRPGRKMLGYATSTDGINWKRSANNPLDRDHWIEDMMVVRDRDIYYMFAEGEHDQAQWLTSADGVHWTRQGTLDIRTRNGQPLSPGPFGTPTVWHEAGENGQPPAWYLFYERFDRGIWLAKSVDLKIWTNVLDEPVLSPGPEPYDRAAVAMNQIVRRGNRYYAYYHGSGSTEPGRTWTTNVAVSDDLVHWRKYPRNPIVVGNKSSGIVVADGERMRLYTMHDQVDLYLPK